MSASPPGKSIGIIAYLTFIGTIAAYYMNREPRHAFATWHIKNMFGLLIILFVSIIAQNYYVLASDILWWTAFAGWLLSLFMAALGKKQAIPFLSEKFQQWFTFLN